MAKTNIAKEVYGPLTKEGHTQDAPAVEVVFPDGNTERVALSDLPAEVVTRLAVHGLSQKLGDSYASAGQQENPLAFAKQRVADVAAQLREGDWRVTSEGGTTVTLLGRALARATGQTEEAAMAKIREREEGDEDEGKAFKKALRAHPDIKKATADIKAEDAKKAQERAAGLETGEAPSLGQLFGG